MNIPANELTSVIFKKPLQECTVEELQQLVQQYPYFGPAHLLLAKKLKEENSSLYHEQLQNTSLYFQNRIWLHHLLNDDGSTNVAVEKEMPATAEEQNQPVEIIITENKQEETINGSNKAQTREQIEANVEVPAVINEPSALSFENGNTEVQPAIETGEEQIKEAELPLDMRSLKIEPVTTNSEVIFEPYHTVDYFASQGIKFKEEEKPKDRFSSQLKSFTEWLKTMKRVPVSEIIATNDPGSEKKVEQMAEYSLAERHVITEAMAEVWKKQGNKTRAEDIYHKLSLLDPSKSSYFAAKIEELKKPS